MAVRDWHTEGIRHFPERCVRALRTNMSRRDWVKTRSLSPRSLSRPNLPSFLPPKHPAGLWEQAEPYRKPKHGGYRSEHVFRGTNTGLAKHVHGITLLYRGTYKKLRSFLFICCPWYYKSEHGHSERKPCRSLLVKGFVRIVVTFFVFSSSV